MGIKTPKNIQKFQTEYKEFVFDYKSLFQANGITLRTISLFLDEVKFFWLERLDIIDFELEELTETNSCFVLSGAIYLNVSEYEHFYFKSMGDYHLLFDPFLKMEHFFRVLEDKIDSTETIEYFRRVFSDTIELLTHYQDSFLILPIRQLAVKDEKQRHDLLRQYFLSFLSYSFNKEFVDQDDFCKQYQTFEQIEQDMDPYVCKNLIFNEYDTEEMSLREKLERHYNSQMNFGALMVDQPESQIFLVSLFSWLSQIIEILLICLYLRLIPYIRFNITFHYLVLIMYTFLDDQKLKEVIEQTIVFYIFRKTVDEANFTNKNLAEYSTTMRDHDLLANILNKIRKEQIDIFHGGFGKVELIIQEEFACC